MSKSNVKHLHALIDELADAGQADMLTALHTIMMSAAAGTANDGDLDLDDLTEAKPARGKAKAKKGRGRKAAASDELDDDDLDDEDDAAEADDDDELGGLDDLEVDNGEDEKPAKKKRGKKAAVEEDDDEDEEAEAGELPVLEDAEGFDDFLDEVDGLTDEDLVVSEAGIRELTKEISETYGIDAADFLQLDEDAGGREGRKAKQAAYGLLLAKLDYISEQLIELGEEGMAEVAEALETDIDEAKGRGKAKLKAQAAMLVEAAYAGEDAGEAEDDEDEEEEEEKPARRKAAAKPAAKKAAKKVVKAPAKKRGSRR